jgi:hypothetical protein
MKATNIIICILLAATLTAFIASIASGRIEYAFVLFLQLGWLSIVWYLLSQIYAKSKMITILREQLKSIQSPIQTNKIK